VAVIRRTRALAVTTALAALVSFALLATVTTPAAPAAPAASAAVAKVTNGCLTSVPDPGTTEPVRICYTLFKPAGASGRHRVPMILHSHGWGGSRTTDPAALQQWLVAKYGVLSFDQRGFGESGGHAYVENPDVEGHDVTALVDLVAGLKWVRRDGPGDPRLGAIGGSYGGGYQFLAAFEELRQGGKPVFDALAPEITWHDLNRSLAPEGVVRTEWALALGAAGLPTDALPPDVYKALVEGSATGFWPDGSIPGTEDMQTFFARNGPSYHVSQGRRLAIPVLLGQGTTDTLFNLQQGLDNWRRALTRNARKHSIFVAYNGGHALPAVYPLGVDVTSDPCSKKLAGGDFSALALRFMNENLKRRDTGLRGYGRLHLATPASTCTTVGRVAADAKYDVGTVATTETGGAALAFPIAQGPIRIAGSAYLTGTLTALGLNNRAFYGLGVGSTPLDASLVQNNVMPLNELAPVNGEPRRIELPAVAVDVPAGKTLYVIASPVSETFVGMGSRTPGAVILQDTVAHLATVG
jgi:ABC-2 type transport system ATP-binding protein